jgi:GNAT superfamily N-acetyltransferase
MKTTIRRATSADLEAVSDVIGEAVEWLTAKGIQMWSGPAFEPPAIAAGIGDYYLALNEAGVAGVMKLESEDLLFWPDVAKGESLFVHRLAVRRAFAGGTISRKLLDFANAEAIHRGLSYLRLDCAADKSKLRKVYEDFGFRYHSDKTVGPFTVARYEYKIH